MQHTDESSLGQEGRLQPPDWIVVLGANTGGPQALTQLLPEFPFGFPGAIIVVQQMRPGFTRVLADQLSHICKMPVHEPVDGQTLSAARILMAPTGSVVTLARMEQLTTVSYEIHIKNTAGDQEKSANRISTTMTSAAETFGRNSVGVVLTGRGEDGCEGLRSIANAGGIAIAQDAASSVVFDMPSRAIDAGVADELPLWRIADRVVEAVTEVANANAA